MYTLTEDEKLTNVLIYTHNSLYRGEAVSKISVQRVSVWLRSQGAPEYLHLLNPKILLFGAGAVKSISYPEIYISRAEILVFHILPPANDPLDYEEDEKNRAMVPVVMLAGTFQFAGSLRISSQSGFTSSIESSRMAWMSLYNVKITNPYLPQMSPIPVPMLIFNPNKVHFAME